MIITKKRLSRRTLLRGFGASVALPLLDSMIPALTPARLTAAQPVSRFGVVYVGNGMMMDRWMPAGDGAAFEFSPILEPLRPFRERLLVLSGLADAPADPLPGEGTGDHARAGATFLSGVHPKKTGGADIQAGVSMDQIAAKVLGQETQLGSLELALDSPGEFAGGCDGDYSCAYTNTISWRAPATPLPMDNDPRAVFERLFGDSASTDPAERLARIRRDRSMLDSVTRTVARLQRDLGPRDRTKLAEYLDAVRDIERRIQKAESQNSRELPTTERPAGVPASFEEHAKLMYDLQVLAYQCDLTRVITFMVSKEVSTRSYPEIGVPDSHHPLSHHQNDPVKLDILAKINTYHVQMFAYFLDKLRATADAGGSLLDNTTILYGTGISDSNLHLHGNRPILLAGGGAGRFKGGRHLRYPKDTPLTNLHLTLLDKLGVPVEHLGDSSGRLDQLSL